MMVAACSVPTSQAARIVEETAELETLLAEMPWVSEMRDVSPDVSADKVVYQFSFRTCPPCIRFKQEAWPKLETAGVETRLVMTARRSKSTADERTAVVELARTRDWDMAQEWMKANSPKGYYKKMTVNGIDMKYPTILWQDTKNVWRAEIGYHSAIADDIIMSLGVQ